MMNRTIILTTLLLACSIESFSQQIFNTEKNDSSNVYFYALIKYCDHVSREQSEIQTVYVYKNYPITKNLPDKIKSHAIKYLEDGDIVDLLKGRNALTVLRIDPLGVTGNDFFVNAIPFVVISKKDILNYIKGKGLRVRFEFNTRTKGLIFKSIEMGGI